MAGHATPTPTVGGGWDRELDDKGSMRGTNTGQVNVYYLDFSATTALQSLHQIHNAAFQRVSNCLQRLKADVALAPLDFPDVSPVQAGFIGENILGPTLLLPQRPHFGPDLLLDVLHQKQFEATLFLTILVITSRFLARQRSRSGKDFT